ncbi:GNAT family N-acetyltransferase [Deinococcus metallilatus]|uniref:GNAT family N-acetyltransferase n=1 Tax=Deinococcus metallilatus TaxID=1211322 RepID=A0AAJ5F0N3_9DEIO|nr:GNAT family N-acetyltransferase [Deinococcus metallilatus]MBB5297175.1 GNAT superfamily N-acetyltransferase [Deinococcus metallilatus]QBY10041.1 GNAT family N-acetyltransferase [Deinococcus metallilatus]RXJ08296.1 GNAT family N-acetyltransferase [Deinococcus metallilatus]TLK21994.1 GNAT family N-acetyltransferase [Deinococcus metallilatus]GMA17260.1 GNAT family N-acetyltransferase [Deinococcus metallilatus]
MSVRPFTAADLPAWVALSNLVLERNVPLEAVQAEDARRDPARFSRRWVVEEGGEVRGLAHLYFFPFDPPGSLHASILVQPEARGQGVGRALWAVLEQAAREAGASGLTADVSDTDPQSLAWAERRSFHQHAHRFASELDLGTFDETPYLDALARAEDQGVTFTDLGGADEATLERYLDFYADRLIETPDLAGHPRWPLAQVRETLHLDHAAYPKWLILAVGPDGEWLGTTAMVRYREMAYNELTAVHPRARGRGLALPLKLHAIRRAREAGLTFMRTNNHSRNAPMLAVNRRLGFEARPGKYEMHLPLVTSDV